MWAGSLLTLVQLRQSLGVSIDDSASNLVNMTSSAFNQVVFPHPIHFLFLSNTLKVWDPRHIECRNAHLLKVSLQVGGIVVFAFIIKANYSVNVVTPYNERLRG